MKKTTAALLKSAALLPGKAGGCGPVLHGRRPSARRVLLSWLCCRSSFWLQLLAAFRRWHLCSSLLPLAAGNLACNCCACSTPAGNFACNHSLLLLLLPAAGCCGYLPIWSKISMGGFRILSVSSVPHGLFLLLILYRQPLAAQDVPCTYHQSPLGVGECLVRGHRFLSS